jgi:pyrimidine oxygenase
MTLENAHQFGVFMPIAQGGWIISKTRPAVDATYALNRQVAILADELGLDFIMSMAKWRGYGGETNHWQASLESTVLMSALAEVTKRVKIWTTLHTLLHNPAVAAKMISTLDQISNGRVGLNIVAGAYKGEFEQMGAWRDDLDHDQRYDLAREWIDIVKKLWTEENVTVDGKYFKMDDCESYPKPISRPLPDLISAGMSDKGLRFGVEVGAACFIGGRDEAELGQVSRRAKQIAAEANKTVKTFAMYAIVEGATDAEAQARAQHYIDGVDVGAVKGMLASYGLLDDGRENSMIARSRQAFMSSKLVGSAESIARQIVDTVRGADLDGMMLVFPDFVDDLKGFGERILPLVRRELGQI